MAFILKYTPKIDQVVQIVRNDLIEFTSMYAGIMDGADYPGQYKKLIILALDPDSDFGLDRAGVRWVVSREWANELKQAGSERDRTKLNAFFDRITGTTRVFTAETVEHIDNIEDVRLRENLSIRELTQQV